MSFNSQQFNILNCTALATNIMKQNFNYFKYTYNQCLLYTNIAQ